MLILMMALSLAGPAHNLQAQHKRLPRDAEATQARLFPGYRTSRGMEDLVSQGRGCAPRPPLTPTLTSQSQSTPASPEALWQLVRAGADQDAVIKVFPSATSPRQPEQTTDEKLQELLTASTYVLGHPATAHFFFVDGSLAVVSIRSKVDESPEGLVGNVYSSLKRTYGAPSACASDDISLGAAACNWTTGEVIVTFLGSGRAVSIDYFSRLYWSNIGRR